VVLCIYFVFGDGYVFFFSFPGKTQWCLKMFRDNKNIFSPPITHLVWCFAIEDKEVFQQMKQSIPNTRFVKGFSAIQSDIENGRLFPKRKENDHFCLVLDDMMVEVANNEVFGAIFSKYSVTSVIFFLEK
jgi:hypothetical protein